MKQLFNPNSVSITSITGCIHDTGYGGYPYKVVVMIQLPATEYVKLRPIKGHGRDLGSLVLTVNNALYALNPDIPAYNPSIDSKGHKRAVRGIKTMEFVYFFKDHRLAQRLGFKVRELRNGEFYPEYSQYVDLNPKTQPRAV